MKWVVIADKNKRDSGVLAVGGLTESIMSDMDTLIVTFQTQLSDVMEAVVKTAMFEVTRLVEDVLLVEVRRGKQEVESLRLQLHTTEGKFSGDGGKTRRFVDSARTDSDQSTDTIEERTPNVQDGKNNINKNHRASNFRAMH